MLAMFARWKSKYWITAAHSLVVGFLLKKIRIFAKWETKCGYSIIKIFVQHEMYNRYLKQRCIKLHFSNNHHQIIEISESLCDFTSSVTSLTRNFQISALNLDFQILFRKRNNLMHWLVRENCLVDDKGQKWHILKSFKFWRTLWCLQGPLLHHKVIDITVPLISVYVDPYFESFFKW